MALKVIWSPQAIETFSEIVDYLHKYWTEKEVTNFVRQSNKIIEHICYNPGMYRESEKKKHQHRAFIFKPVSLVYRYKPRKKEIELITFWNNRRNPKKLKH